MELKAHVRSESLCLATHCHAVAVVDDGAGYFEDDDDIDDSCYILAINIIFIDPIDKCHNKAPVVWWDPLQESG